MSQAPLHFVAILPPEDILSEIKAFKMAAWEKFHSRRALNSPAHITLIPPFKLEKEKQEKFDQYLSAFVAAQSPFDLTLKDFNHFDDRVIFVDIMPNQSLNQLYQDINAGIPKELELKIPKYRGFNPHITVAFRDLSRDIFRPAWAYFSALEYACKFTAKQIVMLRHNGKDWDIIRHYQLGDSSELSS